MSAAEKEVEPDCRMAGRIADEDNEWVEEPLTDDMREWFNACGHCFPDGDIGDLDVVVTKKRRLGTTKSLHRPK